MIQHSATSFNSSLTLLPTFTTKSYRPQTI